MPAGKGISRKLSKTRGSSCRRSKLRRHCWPRTSKRRAGLRRISVSLSRKSISLKPSRTNWKKSLRRPSTTTKSSKKKPGWLRKKQRKLREI